MMFSRQIQAQDIATGMAQVIELNQAGVPDGSVICASDSGFAMCEEPYSTQMHGVVVDSPAGYYEPEYLVSNPRYVLNSGLAAVRYNQNGENLNPGEKVTSGLIPGTVEKALENGYVLGTVVKQPDPGSGKVVVAINIHPDTKIANTRSNLIAVLREGTSAPILNPLDSLRYLLAAMLMIASFIIGFVYFGRMASSGVIAMGRNPLASRQIQFNMFLHIGITIFIVLVGLTLSYLILIV